MASVKPTKVKASGVRRNMGVAPGYDEQHIPSAEALSALLDRAGSAFPGHAMRRLRLPDRSFRYTYASPGIARWLGLDLEAITRQSPAQHEWIVDQDRARFVEALHASADTLGAFDQEVRVTAADGRVVWIRSLGYPRRLPDGTVVWDGIALDVTDRREAAAAVTRALAEARAAEAAQARLVATVNERLRGPLLRALAAAETLPPAAPLRRALDEIAAAIDGSIGPGAASPVPDALTPRQRDVARLLADGRSNAEIGQALGISAGTAKLHVAAAMKRLGARNRAQAAVLARG